MMPVRLRRPLAGLFAAVILTMTAACGDEDAAIPTVSGAWARNSPAMQDVGAVYLRVEGGDTDDAIVGASVPGTVAMKTELHETRMDHATGMMRMSEVEAIPVPAGQTVDLAPGGLHIMLMGLTEPLEVGFEFVVTITFEHAGTMDVTVEVREE